MTFKPSVKRKRKPFPARPSLPIGTRIIALDVSSKAAGLAYMLKADSGPTLIRTALITPRASWEAFRRIDYISTEVARFAREHKSERAVIEFTTGATWQSKHRGSTYLVPLVSSQAVARAAMRHYVLDVDLVSETEWTGGIPKEVRAESIRTVYPDYRTVKDPGLDVADAIGLGQWRLER